MVWLSDVHDKPFEMSTGKTFLETEWSVSRQYKTPSFSRGLPGEFSRPIVPSKQKSYLNIVGYFAKFLNKGFGDVRCVNLLQAHCNIKHNQKTL